jgi:transcriptional regulator with XRE-family HTH domain
MGFDRLDPKERAAMAKRLKAARYTAGLTVRKVAADLGVHVASVTQWESGTVPVPETRAQLAALYHVDEDNLFREVAAHEAEARDLLQQG